MELARRMNPPESDVTLACLRKGGPLLEKLNGSSVRLIEFHRWAVWIRPAGSIRCCACRPSFLEVIEDGATGLLIAPGDPQALAGAIVRLLGDRDLATRIARNGCELVNENSALSG